MDYNKVYMMSSVIALFTPALLVYFIGFFIRSNFHEYLIIYYVTIPSIVLSVLILVLIRRSFRIKTKILTPKNVQKYLKKGIRWFNLQNKEIKIRFDDNIVTSKSNYLQDKKIYLIYIPKKENSSRSYLALIHELCHIKNGDCDNHKENSFWFAVLLASKYIYIYEPRCIWYEVINGKKFIE